MEFSKFWLLVSGLATVALTVCTALGYVPLEITLAAFAETSVCTGFYFWKARTENRSKYTQKFVRQMADKYGVDAALRAAEIATKE